MPPTSAGGTRHLAFCFFVDLKGTVEVLMALCPDKTITSISTKI